jgi:hypothetical protein
VTFEWFIYLLNQLELEQAEKDSEMERFLELHLYMTSMKNHASLEAFGLQMALDFIYEKVYSDYVPSRLYVNADKTSVCILTLLS